MNILVTAPMREKDRAELDAMFDKVVYTPWTINGDGYSAECILKMLQEADADALISELDDVNESVLDAYHKLQFIGDCRANPVNIDLAAATKYKIPVMTTPARNAQSVAELLVGCLVSFMRNIPAALNWVRDGRWVEGTMPYHQFMGNEICGKKVGFVAMGAVGRATARILEAFGAEIAYYDPFIEMEQYEKLDLETLFSTCDIVSLHLPVLPSTRGMIGADLLEKMKPSAIFINTSRSAVMDMNALYKVLQEKRIVGAILDVFDHEPPTEEDWKIIRLDNVLATPHICGASYQVGDHQSMIILDRVKQWFKRENLQQIVFNKGIFE